MRTSLLLAFLLCAPVLRAQDDDACDAVVRTTLTEIRAEPDAYRNVKVTFAVQFASLGKLSNPFFTRFTPTDYVNLYVWGDEQPIWRKEAYENLFGMLFYSKLNQKLQTVYDLHTYERIQITGVVRNTFQETPWIEILDFTPVNGAVDLAVLTHLYRGEKYMAERRWQRAIAELTMAMGGGSPEAVQFSVHRNLGQCYLRIGETSRALEHLQRAVQMAPAPDSEVERLLSAASTAPASELDRTVNQAGLKDFERPMWEAFEKVTDARNK